MTTTTPNDEPFRQAELDSQLDALAHGTAESPRTSAGDAYHHLTQLYASRAAREAQTLERVRQRLAAASSASATAGLAQHPLAPPPHQPAAGSVPGMPAADIAAGRHPRTFRRVSRRRTFIGGIAAVIAVGCLLASFLALYTHQGIWYAPASTAYHWQIIPSPNTPLDVNTLLGITMRTATDGWAWGEANLTPTNQNSNPVQQPFVEHWDGHQWRIVATPDTPYGGQITDIAAIAPDNAWAVGNQLITPTWSENTTGGTLMEHWDGHSWTLLPHPLVNGNFSALAALSAADIWAVGSTGDNADPGLIQHFDGRTWQSVAHPAPPPPSGVQFQAISARAPNDIWAVGSGNGRRGGGVFEHWDGTRWNLVSAPSAPGIGPLVSVRRLSAISAVSANDVWAAGLENPVIPFPNAPVPLFEHWDGHTWSVVASPSITGKISAIVALGPNDVWAVGMSGMGLDTGQVGQALVEHWDGHTWTLIANASPHPFAELGGVSADPSTPGKVWVAGDTGAEFNQGDQLMSTRTLIETTQ